MSSYNNIEKIKYASADCVVTLREYVIFEDERAEEKYVVFKFSNNVSQQLLGMEFEVSQYDIDNNLVEKSVVIYNKFLAKPDEPFVPNAKLKVNYACKRLSVRLVQAAFDRFIWKEGKYLDNSYKFEHYARDEDTEAAKRFPAKDIKVKEQKPAPAPKKRKKGLPFTAKNTTRKNIARFPGVFNFFVCILIFAAIGLSIYFFNAKATAFTLDNFDLKIVDGNAKTVSVTGYAGEDTDLTIPAKIGDYTVIKIDENAFKNSEITSVRFNSSKLYIESCAFYGCENLKTVFATGEVTVKGEAFENCSRLESVTLPNSTLLIGCLKGCNSLTYLEYKSTDAKTVDDLFSDNAPKNLKVVTDGNAPDEGDGGDGGSSFTYDPNATYEYGFLSDKNVAGYYQYDNYETVNGEIITVNPKGSPDLVLKEGVKGVSEKVYSQLGVFTSLKIEGDTYISPEAAAAFENVYSLDVARPESVIQSLNFFVNAKNLSLPCYKDVPLVDQYPIGGVYLDRLEIKSTPECTIIPDNAFNDIAAGEIVVAEGFTYCGTNILSDNLNVYSITLPRGINYGNGVIGYGCDNLFTVDVYLDDFNTRYDDFNLSYDYTWNLTVRTDVLNGYGYLENSYYNLKKLEIHAQSAEYTLFDFVFGDIYTEPRNYPTVYLDLAYEFDDFRTYYKEDRIIDI